MEEAWKSNENEVSDGDPMTYISILPVLLSRL